MMTVVLFFLGLFLALGAFVWFLYAVSKVFRR